jgi:hypothetical protein
VATKREVMSDEAVTILNFEDSNAAINSPRTLEACLRSGFDPKELYKRNFDYFLQREGHNEQIAKLKFKHFEKRRKEKIQAVTEERTIIIAYLKQQTELQQDSGPTGPSAEEQIKAQMERETSTMMKMERDRLRKLKARQAKEIRQIVETEEKVARIQKENSEKEKRDQERSAILENEKKARRAEIATKKRETLV